MQLGREYEPKFPSQEQTDYLKWSFFCLLKKWLFAQWLSVQACPSQVPSSNPTQLCY